MKRIVTILLVAFALNGAAQTADTMTAADHLTEYAKLSKQKHGFRGVTIAVVLFGAMGAAATGTIAPMVALGSIGVITGIISWSKEIKADKQVGRAAEKLRTP